MKANTVIWSCLSCEWWDWGRYDEYPEVCPLCGGEMFKADKQAAIETYWCMKGHERREHV